MRQDLQVKANQAKIHSNASFKFKINQKPQTPNLRNSMNADLRHKFGASPRNETESAHSICNLADVKVPHPYQIHQNYNNPASGNTSSIINTNIGTTMAPLLCEPQTAGLEY